MSATGTQLTKGQRMAAEIAEQRGGVAVRSGSGGMRLVSNAEAERRKLIDAARAELEQKEQAAKALDKEADATAQPAKAKKAKRIPAALNLVPTPKATPPARVFSFDFKPLKLKDGADIPATHKQCSRCKQVLPLEAFASDKSNKRDGRYGMDRRCEREARQAKLAQAATPAPVKKGNKKKAK